jgi:hypothetical protein
MPFESIHALGPEFPEGRQPVVELLEGLRSQPVHTTLGVHRGFHETGVSQHAQVLRHRRLRHPQLTLNLPDRLFRRNQQAQDGASIRLGNDGEDRFHVRRYTSPVIYVSRYIQDGANARAGRLIRGSALAYIAMQTRAVSQSTDSCSNTCRYFAITC